MKKKGLAQVFLTIMLILTAIPVTPDFAAASAEKNASGEKKGANDAVVKVVYEAEEATLSAAITDTKHPGFSGKGFVDFYPNAPGGYIEWTADLASEGGYTLIFRYANGTADNRAAEIQVNGEVVAAELGFPGTGAWTDYGTTSVQAKLKAGSNTIRATAVTTGGGGNIDYLMITNLSEEALAESAVLEEVPMKKLLGDVLASKLDQLGMVVSEAPGASADEAVTRIQFMSRLNDVLGFRAETKFAGYAEGAKTPETAGAAWYEYVLKAADQAGYVQGVKAGGIDPERPITREEAAVMAARALNLEPRTQAADKLADAGKLGAWSKGLVGAVVDGGYMAMRGDHFDPQAALTENEAEALLQAITKLGRPAHGVHIVSADVLSRYLVAVTLNGRFENMNLKDIALQVPTGAWSSLTPKLENLAVKRAALGLNRFGQSVIVYETVEPIGNNATFTAKPAKEEAGFSGDLKAAVARAKNIVSWQMEHGGWSKAIDYAKAWDGKAPRSAWLGPNGEELGMIDNDATTTEIRFLAEVYRETKDEALKDSILKGLDFLLTMQYDNGGFPQVYPKRGKAGEREQYSNFVTYNDGAMIHVLELFDDILQKKYPFDSGLVDKDTQAAIGDAVDRAVDYILKSQIEVNGKLTAWCAQHDPVTYEPRHARAYEHPSISGSESVGIVQYLMSRPEQTPEIQRAVLGALEWFDEVKLDGIRYVKSDPNGEYFVRDESAVTWYRFYEIGTNLPIFSGRDGVMKRKIQEIEQERRDGYSWGGSYAKQLMETAKTTGYYPGKIYAVVTGTKSVDREGRTLAEGQIMQVKEATARLNETHSRLVVARDGSGDYTSVQAAIDAVPKGNGSPVEIYIKNGTYKEVVTIPAEKPFITLIGESAEGTVLTYDNYAGKEKPGGGTYGTGGSASAFFYANDLKVWNLTIENSFDESSADVKNKQAVAAYVAGERGIFENVRFIGNQDTLYTHSGSQYFYNCYIEGDVDFIFGGARAVFDHCTIFSLDRKSDNNGYITAASTLITQPYGYLIINSRLESDAAAGTVHLGRPWHPGGNPDAIASVVYMNTYMGQHIKSEPWTDMSGFSWKEARFHEYNNYGPGAAVTDARPQLTDKEAENFAIQRVLGWMPPTVYSPR